MTPRTPNELQAMVEATSEGCRVGPVSTFVLPSSEPLPERDELPEELELHGVRFTRVVELGPEPIVSTMPGVPESLRALRRSASDHADHLEREAEHLETRAYAMRLEAFQARNLHRLASRHAIGETP